MGEASGEVGGEEMEKGVKQSMEYGGTEVNHSRARPLRLVGNALQKMASSYVYRATWVTYTLRCSSGSVSPT